MYFHNKSTVVVKVSSYEKKLFLQQHTSIGLLFLIALSSTQEMWFELSEEKKKDDEKADRKPWGWYNGTCLKRKTMGQNSCPH